MDNQGVVIRPKKKKAMTIVLCVLVIVLLGLFFYFVGVFDYVKNRIQSYRALRAYDQLVGTYEKTLTDDVYGGGTPQETLDMFIAALEKGDIDLASKYFALDNNLSRKEWEDGLKLAQEEGRIGEIIDITRRFIPEDGSDSFDTSSSFDFVILGNDGVADYILEMTFNQYSKVWKIESM